MLINGGTTLLNANTVTVHVDYDNPNFGTGDAFNRRAGVVVSGTGNRLIAAGDANQGIGGAGVTGGITNMPSLVIGNVHVGANTATYEIQNTGSSGPALRGAVQTGVNGGVITDARLSGNGVTAGNWGPVAAGGSLSRDVTLTIDTAGVYAPLIGQAVNIVNNFDNTRSQLLSITSAAGAAAYRYAEPVVNPVLIDLVSRVGGSASAVVGVSNAAPADGFSEGLNASFGAAPAGFSAGGSISNLAAGGTDGTSLQVSLVTGTSGAFGGTVGVNLVSTGAGTSGLADTSLGTTNIGLSGRVYAPAVAQLNTPTVSFGIVHVGDVVGTQAISVTNAASGALTDTLNASFAAVGGPFSGGGSFSGLGAGSTSAGAITVGLSTAAAGVFNGTATIDATSHNPELADLALPTLNVGVTAQVNSFANGVFEKLSGDGIFSRSGDEFTLDFGTLTLGSSVDAQLAVLNDVLGPADLLDGEFFTEGALHFTATGFDAFADVAAGESFGGLSLAFDATMGGDFESRFRLSLVGHNAGGYRASMGDIFLNVHANVNVAAIPEPETYALILAGLGLLGFVARRRRLTSRAS